MVKAPLLSPDPETGGWVLRERVHTQLLDLTIDIPAGFRTDLASIPRIFWSVVGHPAKPRIVLAALIHDWLYSTQPVSRFLADIAFLYVMLRCGAEKPFLKFFAVRVGGLEAWHGR